MIAQPVRNSSQILLKYHHSCVVKNLVQNISRRISLLSANEEIFNVMADVSDVDLRVPPATVFWHEVVGPCLARPARLHLGLLFAAKTHYYCGELSSSLYIDNAGPYVLHCFLKFLL